MRGRKLFIQSHHAINGMKNNKYLHLFPLLGCYLFITGVLLFEIIKILQLNKGFFVYTLDDAYIHLSLAENILQGHYGVNPGEFSAPSSSILWPFLLAPFSRFELAPLIINILAAFATVWIYSKITLRSFSASQHKYHLFVARFILVLLILSTNVIGLVFTGMEHSLQVLVVSIIVWGLVLVSEGDSDRLWLYIAIGLAPLIRYENLAVSAASLLFLALHGHLKKSLIVSAFIFASLGGFSLFLLANGQKILPASMLVKSALSEDNLLVSFYQNFLHNLQSWFGVLSILLLVLFAGLALFVKMGVSRRHLAVVTILALLMHLWAGRVGWYRYEIYMVVFLSLVAVYLVGSAISPVLDRPGMLWQWTGLTVALAVSILFSNFPYVMLLAYLPLSSNNVYNQEYQMHRFVTEYYTGPAAANDIGYLTYKNDAYVLDLYGLASLDAYNYRMAAEKNNWMDILCTERDIDLVMIYEDWYPHIPDKWIKVGDMIYNGQKISIAEPTVAFFATSPKARDEIEQDLYDFIPTLPENTTFIFSP